MDVSFNINGEKRTVTADPETPLLWIVRDYLELTGTKYGCGIGQCGACTVHVDGQPVRSCVLPIQAIGDRAITTIEGLESSEGSAVQMAWDELSVVQCGYCQSGQIMSAAALLKSTPQPNDDDINYAMAGNICRCVTYKRIRDAIKHAATKISVLEV